MLAYNECMSDENESKKLEDRSREKIQVETRDHSWQWLNPDSEQAEPLVIDALKKADIPVEAGTIRSLSDYFGTTFFDTEAQAGEPLTNSSAELAQIVSAKKSMHEVIAGKRSWLVESEIDGIPAFIEFREIERNTLLFQAGVDRNVAASFWITKLVVQTKNGYLDLTKRLPKDVLVRAVVLKDPKERDFYFSTRFKEIVISDLQSMSDLRGYVHEAGHAQFSHVANPGVEEEISQALFFKRSFLNDYVEGKVPDTTKGEEAPDLRDLIASNWLVAQSEHFASAWGLAELNKLFELTPEQILAIKEEYESSFETYDQLPLTLGSTSEAAEAIPYNFKEAIVQHCKWFQTQVESLQLAGFNLSQEFETNEQVGKSSIRISWRQGMLKVTMDYGPDLLMFGLFTADSVTIRALVKGQQVDWQTNLFDVNSMKSTVEVLVQEDFQEAREVMENALNEVIITKETAAETKIQAIFHALAALNVNQGDIDPKKDWEKMVAMPLVERVTWRAMIGQMDNQVTMQAIYPVLRLNTITYRIGTVLAAIYDAKDIL
ncbi:MAG: hypothetical protein QG639_502, partial [Patescibacteria group bacterium]|nr:hypothetical protein [Patescibacteria group bacterium]